MKQALFIGRFQPFHLGHLSAIQQALKQTDFLHIGIGSSQYSGTNENPFTAEERKKMIEIGLREAGIPKEKYQIHLIPDIHDNPKWTRHVKSIVPEFDTLFLTNKGIVKELFEVYEPHIRIVQLKKERGISATEVRKLMKEDGPWEKKVSEAVANWIKFNAKQHLSFRPEC